MKDREQRNPIISGPEPGGLSALIDAWRSLRARWRARAPAVPRVRAPRRVRRPEAATPAREQPVGGPPAVWMAPFFLLFAATFALPQVAKLMEPTQPRAVIARVVQALPPWAAPLADLWAGWLWLPWYVALAALLMRLNAVRVTGRAILDAVGWSMAALVVEGAAWLYWGREILSRPEVAAAERAGAWQLLVAEFVFLFLVSVLFGPNTYRRTVFEA